MDDNCGEWVECMGVASGCCEQEVGVASGSGWNLWVWLHATSITYTSPKTPTCEVPSNGVVEISLLPVRTGETSI